MLRCNCLFDTAGGGSWPNPTEYMRSRARMNLTGQKRLVHDDLKHRGHHDTQVDEDGCYIDG